MAAPVAMCPPRLTLVPELQCRAPPIPQAKAGEEICDDVDDEGLHGEIDADVLMTSTAAPPSSLATVGLMS